MGKNTTTVYYTQLNKNPSTKDVLLPFELLAIGSPQIANIMEYCSCLWFSYRTWQQDPIAEGSTM